MAKKTKTTNPETINEVAELKITKVQQKGDDTIVHYVRFIDGKGKADTTYSSTQERDPAFTDAFQALINPYMSLLSLPDAYGKDCTVTSVSFSQNEKQGMGMVVTIKKHLEGINAPFMIHTPHVFENNDMVTNIAPSLIDSMRQIMALAKDFLNGVRAQGDLFADNEEGEPAMDASVQLPQKILDAWAEDDAAASKK